MTSDEVTVEPRCCGCCPLIRGTIWCAVFELVLALSFILYGILVLVELAPMDTTFGLDHCGNFTGDLEWLNVGTPEDLAVSTIIAYALYIVATIFLLVGVTKARLGYIWPRLIVQILLILANLATTVWMVAAISVCGPSMVNIIYLILFAFSFLFEIGSLWLIVDCYRYLKRVRLATLNVRYEPVPSGHF